MRWKNEITNINFWLDNWCGNESLATMLSTKGTYFQLGLAFYYIFKKGDIKKLKVLPNDVHIQ